MCPATTTTGWWASGTARTPVSTGPPMPSVTGTIRVLRRSAGAVVLIGDDPSCKSSTLPSSSVSMARSLTLPLLSPSSVAEVVQLGLHAVALSRYAGLWTGLQIVADVADGSAVVDLGAALPEIPPPDTTRVLVPRCWWALAPSKPKRSCSASGCHGLSSTYGGRRSTPSRSTRPGLASASWPPGTPMPPPYGRWKTWVWTPKPAITSDCGSSRSPCRGRSTALISAASPPGSKRCW